MRRRGGTPGLEAAALALVLCLSGGALLAQQSAADRLGPEAPFSLGPAFPNPFEEETRIPFVLGEALFREDRRPLVSLRVYNLLHQPIGFAALEPGGGMRLILRELRLERPGRYEAVWDGRDSRGELVMEGPYFLQLSVDGRTQVRKVLFVR